MNAYNELDGVPVAADRGLLTTVLRDEWGFDGCVVADYFSIRQLADYHRLAVDAAEAAAMALAAGLDVELPGTDCFGAPLLQAVRSGRRQRGRRRHRGGAGCSRPSSSSGCSSSRSSSLIGWPRSPTRRRTVELRPRRSPRTSLVLLRNDGVLPLRPDVGTVAVIGPNADDARNLFGDYTYPAHVESLQEVLQSGRNVFAMPIDDAPPADRDRRRRHHRRRRAPGTGSGRARASPRLRRQQSSTRRLRRGRGARRRLPTSR